MLTRGHGSRSRAAAALGCAAGLGISAHTLAVQAHPPPSLDPAAAHHFTFDESPVRLLVWNHDRGLSSGSSWAISRDGHIDFIGHTENLVRLRYATFDPLVRVPRIPAGLAAPADNELFLVQFRGTPLNEMRAQIVALGGGGGSIKRFLTDNTHVVHMDAGIAERVRELPFIRWVGPYHPAYRLDEQILASVQHEEERAAPPLRYGIELMDRGLAAQQPVADFITRAGGIVDLTTRDGRRMEATLSLDQVLALARRNDVNFIDPWSPPETHLDIARQFSGAVPALSSAGFLGQGVRAEVIDSGIQMNHPEWASLAPILHREVQVSSSVNHGTAVYGCLFSLGVQPQATGFLPQYEAGIFGHLLVAAGMSRVTWALESVDPAGPYRVVLQTNSWGLGRSTGAYTTGSADMDDAIAQADLLITQAQGNLGSLESSVQAWAKNVVAVGGIRHDNSLDPLTHRHTTASYGPAADGRIKPELAHFYDNIFTTDGGSAYRTNFGGTSAATPLTAGNFGLVMQMWHAGVWPGFGGAPTLFESRPHYATARALVIASAYRYNWTSGSAPNASLNRGVQGWGIANVDRLYQWRDRTFIINGTHALATGETREYTVHVEPGEPELHITMVYNDPPGNPAAFQARINNLDLRATSPAGDLYLGNHNLMTSNWSIPVPAGTAPDTINTVENIFIQNPAPGAWVIEVIGAQVVADTVPSEPGTKANFGLAILGAAASRPCYANCDGSTTPPILNVEDFTCFVAEFAAAQALPHAQQLDHYANCDGSTTAPVLNVEDFLCFVAEFAQGCP
jgi:serine protease AprX